MFKLSTGPFRRALGIPSTGKNFVEKIVSMSPPHIQEELGRYLSMRWESRILKIGGKEFVQLIDEHPVLMRLIQQELKKIPADPRQARVALMGVVDNIVMTNPNSPILDLVDGFTYFNKVANLLPERYKKFIIKNMAMFWVNRPHKDRGADHMISLLKTPCIQEVIKTQREVLKRGERGLNERIASGASQKEIDDDTERICATMALAFSQGIDSVMDTDFWSDKDGKLIGIKKHRNTEIGQNCGVGFFPDGSDADFPAVPPPPNAVDNGGVKEGESPLAFAPLPPRSMQVGNIRANPHLPLPPYVNRPAFPPVLPSAPPTPFTNYLIPLPSVSSFPKSRLSTVPEQTGSSRRKTRRKNKNKKNRKTRSRR
jgi:hypothetical protein